MQKVPHNASKLLASITFSRVIYTFCWFDAAAASPTLVSVQHYGYAQLGELLSAFMAGAGALQVPAGIFSARRGPARAVTLGLALIALGSFGSAASSDIVVQVATRFVTGVGAAFYFAPAMVVVSNLYKGRSGLIIGFYNAAFNLGGGITLFTLTPSAASWGWRAPYIITGVLTVVALAQFSAAFRGIGYESIEKYTSRVAQTVRSHTVWGVALGILGLSVAYYVASQFIVDYTTNALHAAPAESGLLASLLLFGGLLGGPIIGSLSDRSGDRRIYAVISTMLAALAVALFSFAAKSILVGAALALGFFDSAAYTIAYAIPTDIEGIGDTYAPLAIGLINSVSILCGALAIALFGYSVAAFGYRLSWILTGAVAVLTLPFLRFAVVKRGESGKQ